MFRRCLLFEECVEYASYTVRDLLLYKKPSRRVNFSLHTTPDRPKTRAQHVSLCTANHLARTHKQQHTCICTYMCVCVCAGLSHT